MVKVRQYHSPKDYLDAAGSDETTAEELMFLAGSEYDFVRLAVAGNPNVTSGILSILVPDALSSWNKQAIALALAQNARTSPAVLRTLAEKLIPVLNKDRNGLAHEVAIKLFCNANTPFDVVQAVLNSREATTLVRRKLARETIRKDALRLLAADRSEVVRKLALNRLEILK